MKISSVFEGGQFDDSRGNFCCVYSKNSSLNETILLSIQNTSSN